ncbi:MAG: hypothetical protein CM15mP9_0840 [Methanobacteriota archaeon]|nr:MAG: hypothetical protein CM15mP9_0840 [Euryarchaeota archaeon]
MLAMANATTLMIVDLANPNVAKTTFDVNNPKDVEIVTDDCVAVLENGEVSYWSFDGMEKVGPNADHGDSVILFESFDGQIACV